MEVWNLRSGHIPGTATNLEAAELYVCPTYLPRTHAGSCYRWMDLPRTHASNQLPHGLMLLIESITSSCCCNV
uniref:Uncharacterized protein n=1 Tax=Picea glauca TaxID=3330 RepID=A0A101M0K4_PICGL|nr:hypothetical protein ABT39_MTgene4705 [Picea glauca]QHR90942.1 hypothetical protein Q903MT_gene4971 [Picea sitchensis]